MNAGKRWSDTILVASLISLAVGIFYGLLLSWVYKKFDLFISNIDNKINIACDLNRKYII